MICSGKYVYDVDALLQNNKIDNVALITLEELFPFPEEQLKSIIESTPTNAKICWVQE